MSTPPDKLKPEHMPAFPLHNGDVWGGMLLRDYFAAKALAVMLRDDKLGMTEQGIARMSYHIADAMLKARTE